MGPQIAPNLVAPFQGLASLLELLMLVPASPHSNLVRN